MEKDNATPKGKTVGMVRPSDIGLNGKDPRKPSFCPNMLGESANRNGRESGWRRPKTPDQSLGCPPYKMEAITPSRSLGCIEYSRGMHLGNLDKCDEGY